MPALDREQFNAAIRGIVGESPDDDGLKFISDMNDTFDELSRTTEQVREEMKQQDDEWRKRYADAFNRPLEKGPQSKADHAKSVTISDLFTMKERRH